MAETGQHTAPRAQQKSGRTARNETKAYLVGAGIASLASAAYLIREGGVEGKNICIYEETEVVGGSLDGEGSPGDCQDFCVRRLSVMRARSAL